jgi:hypothetical protein
MTEAHMLKTTDRLSTPKEKLKFVLLEGIHQTALDTLTQDGYTQIVTSPKALAGRELIELIADAHFLGIRSRTQLSAEVLAQAPKLAAVGCFCIGTNQVDLASANQARRARLQRAVLEHAQRGRDDPRRDRDAARQPRRPLARSARRASGARSRRRCFEVRRQDARHHRLRAHRSTARRLAEAGDARRLPRRRGEAPDGQQPLDEDARRAARRRADFVTLHVPETPQTEG